MLKTVGTLATAGTQKTEERSETLTTLVAEGMSTEEWRWQAKVGARRQYQKELQKQQG